MRARAERLPGVDHDLHGLRRAGGRRGLPRRAHAQRRDARSRRAASTSTGRWNSRQRSSQSSATSLVEISTERPARRARAASGQRGQLARARRRRRTRCARPRARPPPRPPGASSSSSASTSSACSARDADGEPDHAAWLPSARRSLANIDSCERRFSSVSAVVELLEQLALLGAQAARDDDVDDHAQVAAAPAAQRRHPLAAQREHLAGLGAGGELERRGALQRRHLERRAERGERWRARRAR